MPRIFALASVRHAQDRVGGGIETLERIPAKWNPVRRKNARQQRKLQPIAVPNDRNWL
jgi:hypothetical protein